MISREMCATDLILYSDRLRLAPLDLSDLELCMQLFSDSKVTKYASAAMKMGGLSAMLPYWIKRGGNGCIGIWSISDRNKGVKLGIIALLPLPIDDDDTDFDLVVPGQMPDGDIEIRYFLLPSAWSNGYATEACTRIIKFVFERTPLKEIVATFDPAIVHLKTY